MTRLPFVPVQLAHAPPWRNDTCIGDHDIDRAQLLAPGPPACSLASGAAQIAGEAAQPLRHLQAAPRFKIDDRDGRARCGQTRAMARPSPEAPPVTTAFRPARSCERVMLRDPSCVATHWRVTRTFVRHANRCKGKVPNCADDDTQPTSSSSAQVSSGLSFAAVFADAGWQVTLVDPDPDRRDAAHDGIARTTRGDRHWPALARGRRRRDRDRRCRPGTALADCDAWSSNAGPSDLSDQAGHLRRSFGRDGATTRFWPPPLRPSRCRAS